MKSNNYIFQLIINNLPNQKSQTNYEEEYIEESEKRR